MDRRQLLQEQYEEALFALLVDEVTRSAEQETKELNEQLKRDPDANVPKRIHKKGKEAIRAAFTQKSRQLRCPKN